jgi:hypothetical protein
VLTGRILHRTSPPRPGRGAALDRRRRGHVVAVRPIQEAARFVKHYLWTHAATGHTATGGTRTLPHSGLVKIYAGRSAARYRALTRMGGGGIQPPPRPTAHPHQGSAEPRSFRSTAAGSRVRRRALGPAGLSATRRQARSVLRCMISSCRADSTRRQVAIDTSRWRFLHPGTDASTRIRLAQRPRRDQPKVPGEGRLDPN